MSRRVVQILFDANLTGGQVFAVRLGQVLREHDWESTYILPADGPLVSLLVEAGLGWEVTSTAGGPLRLASRLARRLSALKPAVLHTHLVLPSQFAARIAGLVSATPVVSHYHITPVFPSAMVRSAAYRMVDRFGAQYLSKANIAVSEAVARSLRELGLPKVSVVPNGVPIPEHPTPAPGHRTLVVLGRITRAKGQDVAVRAITELAEDMPDVRLRIVGDALAEPDRMFRTSLERSVAELGLADRVSMAPATPDVQHELANAWCLVLPSRAGEGMPLVVLEAMAAGVPVVAARLSGVPEVVEHDRTGLLFEPGNSSALATALRRLATEPALIERLATNGRAEAVRSFSIERVASDVAAVYDRVTG